MIAEAQESIAGALLAAAGVTAIVADSDDGPAVFAEGQDFADVYPRITFAAPERVDRSNSCTVSADLFATINSWAKGPDCTLVAGRLADAAVAALSAKLVIAGHRVSSWAFQSSRPIGDPLADVEHFVSVLRYTVQPSA